jgi:hypothetical protein
MADPKTPATRPLPSSPTRSLVLQCLQKDRAAWDQLIAQYGPRLEKMVRFYLASKGVRDSNQVVEILQQIWVILLDLSAGRLGGYLKREDERGTYAADPRSLDLFLAGQARQQVWDWWRSAASRRMREKAAGRKEQEMGTGDRWYEGEFRQLCCLMSEEFLETALCLVSLEWKPRWDSFSPARRRQKRCRFRHWVESYLYDREDSQKGAPLVVDTRTGKRSPA